MTRLLLVEDDLDLAALTKSYLESHGFEVSTTDNGLEAVDLINNDSWDMVLLDIMLPGIDGMEVCRRVRQTYTGPILMLTARDEQIDQILGLELGADAYLSKASEPRLVVAQIKALLRRPAANEQTPQQLEFDQLVIKNSSRLVTVDGNEIILSNPEYDLLWVLASNAGNILSRDDLFNALRGVDYDGQNRLVDITISQLRQKIAPVERIKTVRNKGYMFTI